MRQTLPQILEQTPQQALSQKRVVGIRMMPPVFCALPKGLGFPCLTPTRIPMRFASWLHCCGVKAGRIWPLPFCCTVEAEALGAHINLGNDQIGPRPSGYAYDSLAALMDDNRLLDFSNGRIHAILEACQMLKNQDEMVAVEIIGPVSILSALLILQRFSNAGARCSADDSGFFAHRQCQLERYARELRAAGADLISFADPAAAPHIIGPRFSSMLATTFLAPFLEKVVASLPGAALHLCPHSASGLVKAQLAEWKDAPASGQASHQQACLLAKAGRIFGKRCIKRTSPLPPQGMLPYLQLHKPQEA